MEGKVFYDTWCRQLINVAEKYGTPSEEIEKIECEYWMEKFNRHLSAKAAYTEYVKDWYSDLR